MRPTVPHCPDGAVPAKPNGATFLLEPEPRTPLVDAAALAAELHVSRDFVYEHSQQLGALRLGAGPKARLRFDPIAARAALARYGSEQSQPSISSAGAEIERPPVRQRRSLATGRPKPGSILPIRERPRRRKAAGNAR